jgi:hypothetical protein
MAEVKQSDFEKNEPTPLAMDENTDTGWSRTDGIAPRKILSLPYGAPHFQDIGTPPDELPI